MNLSSMRVIDARARCVPATTLGLLTRHFVGRIEAGLLAGVDGARGGRPAVEQTVLELDELQQALDHQCYHAHNRGH